MKPGESLPDAIAFRREDRDQCQHQTWYFLPWHRGYLRAFERIVAAAIVQLGGPADWALPYCYNDESNRNRLDLPPAFGSQTWPDGGTNPLFVVARYGSTGQSGAPIKLDPRSVSLDDAFLGNSFVGTQIGGSPGFGGGRTPFKHSGRGDEGLLEQSPHDNVHGDIGGARDNDLTDPFKVGLMSNPLNGRARSDLLASPFQYRPVVGILAAGHRACEPDGRIRVDGRPGRAPSVRHA
jgi:tyrosinase